MVRTAGLLLIAGLMLRAQAPVKEVMIRSHAYVPPSAILRAEANLVEAPLTVRDSQGRTIAGLRATDFEVLDNGVAQKITGFSELRADGKAVVAAGAPRGPEDVPAAAIPPASPKYVTFFFDDAHLNNGDLLFAVKGARGFIAKGLKATDWTSIVTTSGQGDLDFTNDAKLFAAKLDKLASHMRPAVGGGCGSVGPEESYIIVHNLDYSTRESAIQLAKSCACGDAEKDSVCRPKATMAALSAASSSWEQTQTESLNTVYALGFASKKLHEANGTRILVLTSAGFLVRAGQPELEKFIDGAVRWNIVIHAIDARGLDPIHGTGLIQSLHWMPLEKLTDGTGGHFFKNSNNLAGAMELAANPEVSYLLAFNPGAHDGKFHKLKIRFKAKRPESVQFRPGYFSPGEDLKLKASARDAMDAAVFTNETLSAVPAKVSAAVAGEGVSVSIVVDLNGVEFKTANGRHGQQIVFLMTLLDSAGGFVTGKEAIMDLVLSDEKLASMQKTGLKAVATLPAAAGKYQVRTIVREAMKGDLAASTIPVELR